MYKNLLKILLVFVLGLWMASGVVHAEDLYDVSVFTADTCGHCQDLKKWVDLENSNGNQMSVKYYNLSEKQNIDLFNQFTDKYKIAKATPIILAGDKVIEGFGSASTTGVQILDLVKKGPKGSFENFLANKTSLTENNDQSSCQVGERCNGNEGMIFDVPFWGKIDVSGYSMPVLSLVLGFIDGFNPCAMWVLIVFITMIAQAKTKRKMWDLVIVFMLAEAVMYYAILNVWFSTWNFVQLDQYVTPIIALISLGAGGFFLWEYWTTKAGECKIIDADTKKKTVDRIADLVNSPISIATFFGTIAIAFSVNIVEFACSIGIPQAFTKILELNDYSFFVRQFFMGLYILTYMADDIIVFVIAIYAIQHLGLTTKYSKYCQLIGGLLMLLIGGIMLYDPTLLKF